jgi:hypothetical protein
MEKSTSWGETRHFRDEEWADLARIQTDERRTRLQDHLNEGCQECARRLRFWTAVGRVAARESAYDPPDAAVRQVRGQYALRKPRSFLQRAALLFDSAREPLPIGVRAGAAQARLLLYGKAGRLLKLRVENLGESESLSLAGQVVEEDAPHRKLKDLPVLVQSGKKTVNQTLTNQSGEFTLDLSPARQLRLVIGLPGPEAIMVVLPVAAAVDDES